VNRTEFAVRLLRALAAVPPAENIPEDAWPLVVAHAAYESGWGSARAASGRNYFNLTAGSRWRGRIVQGPDLEYSDGVVKRITQRFRAYDSDAEAVRDYLAFLSMPRYRPAREALVAGDALRFVQLLGPDRSRETPPVGGYYTLPTARYAAEFAAVLEQVRAALPAEMPIA
jgi:flagellar protein FlgJ